MKGHIEFKLKCQGRPSIQKISEGIYPYKYYELKESSIQYFRLTITKKIDEISPVDNRPSYYKLPQFIINKNKKIAKLS